MESLSNVSLANRAANVQPLINKKVADPKFPEVKIIAVPKATTAATNDQQSKIQTAKHAETAAIKEVIDNNGECGICMSVMVEPVTLPCKHIFCAQCATMFLQKNSKCPLDRKNVPKNYKLTVDKELQAKIRNLVPKEFKAMETEIKKGQGLLDDLVELEFEVGNTYKQLKKFKTTGGKDGEYEHKHSWSFYIKPLNNDVRSKQHLLVEKIQLYLHPTFREPTRWIKPVAGKQMELANVISYGHFPIDVTVHWTKRTGQQIPFSCEHQLVFDPKGAKKTFKIKFDQTKINPIITPKKAPAAAPKVPVAAVAKVVKK